MFFKFYVRVEVELRTTTITALQNLWLFTITSKFYTTFLYFYYVNWHPFTSTQRFPFNISSKAGLVVMKSLSCCLFRKVFISSSFLKKSFGRIRILFFCCCCLIILAVPGLSYRCRIFSCGMWDLVLWPGIKSGSLFWECEVLATGPQGSYQAYKSWLTLFSFYILNILLHSLLAWSFL